MTPDSLIECGFALFMLLVYLIGGQRSQPVTESEEKCYRELEKRP